MGRHNNSGPVGLLFLLAAASILNSPSKKQTEEILPPQKTEVTNAVVQEMPVLSDYMSASEGWLTDPWNQSPRKGMPLYAIDVPPLESVDLLAVDELSISPKRNTEYLPFIRPYLISQAHFNNVADTIDPSWQVTVMTDSMQAEYTNAFNKAKRERYGRALAKYPGCPPQE